MSVTTEAVHRLRTDARVAPVGAALASVTAFAYVGAVDPNQAGHYPTCPFLFLTGHYCPGCGSLRAMHALAHGHVGEALGLNALSTLLLPVLVAIWVRWTWRAFRGTPETADSWRAPGWAIWGLLAVVIAFWILRNLPGLQFLAP